MIDLRHRIERNAETTLHEPRRRLFELDHTVIGISTIFWLVDFVRHHLADRLGSHGVVFADPEIEQFAIRVVSERPSLGTLDLLELVDFGVFSVFHAADAISEQFLEVRISRIGCGWSSGVGCSDRHGKRKSMGQN